jgi:NAD(P)-dependent dehydrogenase (short-subunit alcohol dehydrogenase family)
MAPMTGTVITEWSVDATKAPTDLSGKSMLIVGGTNGLGRAIALESLSKGAMVTVVGRTLQEQDASVNNLTFVKADLSLMTTAKEIGETVCTGSVDSLDVILFTNGIVTKSTREASSEGIELDMAVSYLSRLVMLKYLAPRLKKNCRIFVMGFPGGLPKFNLEDLNAEKSYEGGFGWVHFNTVAGNESLVIESASKTTPNELLYFGLNPGLIKTGIRGNMYEGYLKFLGPILEGLLGLFTTSPSSYASKIVPLLFAAELNEHSGSMFNPNAQPIEISKQFQEDKELASKFIQASETLVKEKTGIDLP